jgi:hypothetical protein
MTLIIVETTYAFDLRQFHFQGSELYERKKSIEREGGWIDPGFRLGPPSGGMTSLSLPVLSVQCTHDIVGQVQRPVRILGDEEE